MENVLNNLIQGKDGLVTTVYLKVPDETLAKLALTGIATGAALKIVFLFIDRIVSK